jgi:hypothetical protein
VVEKKRSYYGRWQSNPSLVMNYYTYKKTKPEEKGWYLIAGGTLAYPHVCIAKWEGSYFRDIHYLINTPKYWAKIPRAMCFSNDVMDYEDLSTKYE